MVEKMTSKKLKGLVLIAMIVLIVIFLIILNNPRDSPRFNEDKCNVSQGYKWNESLGYCIKQSEITHCKPEQREGDVCTQQYDPVCGFKDDNSRETFSNSCFACSNNQTIFYVPGECKEWE